MKRSTKPSSIENTFWEALALSTAAAPASAEAMDRAMEFIGPFYHADRVWIGRFNEGLTHFWGASQWLAPGIVSHMHEIQGVPVEVIAEAYGKFLLGEPMAIPDVERMPRRSRVLQAELRREGVRSTFAYRLMHGGKLIGFYGFDYVSHPSEWSEADESRQPAIGEFLAALLHRNLKETPRADPLPLPDKAIYLTERSGLSAFSSDELIYIQADGDYSHVHLTDGRRYYERRSLRTWIDHLPRERFLRVHQSFLINGGQIASLDRGARWALQLRDVPDPIPVGRAFRHGIRLHMGF